MKKRNTTGKTEKPFQRFQSIRCSCKVSTETSRKVVRCSIYRFFPMVGHLFQNYDTIYVRFFPRILAIIPATRYTCVFLPRILAFFLTNAHIYAHKKVHIYALQTSIWGHRKSSYKRHRIIPSPKNPFMYDEDEK